MEIKTLKVAVRDAFSAMESAAAGLEAVTDETLDTEINERQEAFEAAERDHKAAVETLERAERVAAARESLPTVPAEDSAPEGVVTSTAGANVRMGVAAEPDMYRSPDKAPRFSFFQDLWNSRKGDSGAQDRLARHQAHELEKRAVNNTDGAGGDFVPPAWLISDYVHLARAGRVTADATFKLPLPQGTDSINVPRITGGVTVAALQDGNNASNTDITSDAVTAPVVTIAGNADVQRSAMERSTAAGAGLDKILAKDLALAYATAVDTQVLSGSGSSGNARGILATTGINQVTFTTGSPTLALLYPKLADAVNRVHTGRFLAPTAIVMHPSRWAWFLSQVDSTGRPFIPAQAPFNPVGALSDVASEGIVGQLLGLPVIVDPSVPVNRGAGTDQDAIIVARFDDLYLYEDETPRVKVFEQALTDKLQIRVQLYNYLAFSAGRLPKSVSTVEGTGLKAPTF